MLLMYQFESYKCCDVGHIWYIHITALWLGQKPDMGIKMFFINYFGKYYSDDN